MLLHLVFQSTQAPENNTTTGMTRSSATYKTFAAVWYRKKTYEVLCSDWYTQQCAYIQFVWGTYQSGRLLSKKWLSTHTDTQTQSHAPSAIDVHKHHFTHVVLANQKWFESNTIQFNIKQTAKCTPRQRSSHMEDAINQLHIRIRSVIFALSDDWAHNVTCQKSTWPSHEAQSDWWNIHIFICIPCETWKVGVVRQQKNTLSDWQLLKECAASSPNSNHAKECMLGIATKYSKCVAGYTAHDHGMLKSIFDTHFIVIPGSRDKTTTWKRGQVGVQPQLFEHDVKSQSPDHTNLCCELTWIWRQGTFLPFSDFYSSWYGSTSL